jgi:hypothetical protein
MYTLIYFIDKNIIYNNLIDIFEFINFSCIVFINIIQKINTDSVNILDKNGGFSL